MYTILISSLPLILHFQFKEVHVDPKFLTNFVTSNDSFNPLRIHTFLSAVYKHPLIDKLVFREIHMKFFVRLSRARSWSSELWSTFVFDFN